MSYDDGEQLTGVDYSDPTPDISEPTSCGC